MFVGGGGAGLSADSIALTPGLAVYNFKPGMLRRFRAAMAGVRQGTGSAIVAAAGDSTDRGQNSAAPAGKAFQQGWPRILSDELARAGIPSSWQNIFGNIASGLVTTSDDRLVYTGTIGQSLSTIGRNFRMTAASSIAFTPIGQVDRLRFGYIQNTGQGTFNWNVDGGANTLINASAAKSVQAVTATPALGTHTLNLIWASGDVSVLFMHGWNSAAREVRVYNWGWPSSATSNWIGTTDNWSPLNALAALEWDRPNLIVLHLGLNDANTPVTADVYETNLNTIITAALVNSDVVLKALTPADVGWAPLSLQAEFLQRQRRTAAARGLPLIDVNTQFGSYALSQPAGYYNDTVHLSAVGYADVGRAVAKFLLMVA